MASTHDKRFDRSSAQAGRFGVRGYLLAVAALALVLAAAVVAATQLAKLRGDDERTPVTSSFLAEALGVPRASAPLVRKPAKDVQVRIDRAGYDVRQRSGSLSLASTAASSRPWRRFADGAQRTAPFGKETITVGPQRTEQFLTVTKRQGLRTWTWRLDTTTLKPSLS